MPPAVVDVFGYNGEPIVARRLAYLSSAVDAFVVVEARKTFSGLDKDLFVERDRAVFEPYLDKIRFVTLDEFPPVDDAWAELQQPWVLANKEAWWREGYQRDAALDALRDLRASLGPLVAFVCDADEIPSRAAVQHLVERHEDMSALDAVHLDMDFFYYSCEWTNPEPWTRAFAVHSDRLGPGASLTALRHRRPVAVMRDAGWHCSYFMTPRDMARKIASFAHREVDTPETRDERNLQDRAARGDDILGRAGTRMRPTPRDRLDRVPAALRRDTPRHQ